MKQFFRTLILALMGVVLFSACSKKDEPGDIDIEGKRFVTSSKSNDKQVEETFSFFAGTVRYSHYSKETKSNGELTRTLTGTYSYDAQRKLYVLKLDKEKVEGSGQAKIEQKISLNWTLTISSDGQTITISGKDDNGSSSYRIMP